MPSNFSGQLYQYDHVPVPLGSNIPLLTPQRSDSSGTSTQEYGKIYWVGKGGDDNNDGESWEKRKLTIASAISLAQGDIDTGWGVTPWAPSNTIIVAPGLYAENLTGGLWGTSLIGLGDARDINGQRGVTVKPTSGSPWDSTSVINSRIENICFESPDTSVVFENDNFNRNVMINCVFQGLPGASPTTTRGFEVVKDMTGSYLGHCWFNQIRNGIYLVADNANSKQITGNRIEYCVITGGDQTGIYFDANCTPTGTTIAHCHIAGAGATLALGLDDNTGVVDVAWTTFSATACDPASADSDSKYNGCYLNGTLMT